jgi:membrane peptidoglycan carboxypeptidase
MINLEDVPKNVINAAIVAEDRGFWQHQGFSITGIIRAILVDIFQGGRLQGGSTITQQLIKNAILTSEKSYERKIKEIALAYKIEQKFAKEEILKMYFNEIPYGSTAYGIEAAAQTYFGKSVKNVTLGEAAVLAALPKRPTYLSPYGNHQDELFARQHYLLAQMVQE